MKFYSIDFFCRKGEHPKVKVDIDGNKSWPVNLELVAPGQTIRIYMGSIDDIIDIYNSLGDAIRDEQRYEFTG